MKNRFKIPPSKNQSTISTMVEKLSSLQRDDGSFCAKIIETDLETSAIFPTLMCADIMSTMNIPHLRQIKDRLQLFITNNLSRDNRLNYYGTNRGGASQHIIPKYPDDLDDFSLGLIAVLNTDPKSSGTDFNIKRNMTSAYIKSLAISDCSLGGPFNTWIIKRVDRGSHWHDIDPVVNANISRCMRKLGETPSGLQSYLDTCIRREHFHSKYYDDKISVMYALAKTINSRSESHTIDIFREQFHNISEEILSNTKDAKDIDILKYCRVIYSLVKLGGSPGLIHNLYEKMVVSPFPNFQKLYIERIANGSPEHINCDAVTISTMIEALLAYEIYDCRASHPRKTKPRDRDDKMMISNLLNSHIIRSPSIKNRLSTSLEKILSLPKISQIIRITNEANDHLPTEKRLDIIESSKLFSMGLMGWVIWTDHDEKRDGDENSETFNLPFSSICMAMFYDIMRQLHLSERCYTMIIEIMGYMERANLEELTNSKSSTGHKLKEIAINKSLGMVIPMIALLDKIGAGDTDISTCKKYFRHLILARQLSDDACDWSQDLHRDKETLVTKLIRGSVRDGKISIRDVDHLDDRLSLGIANDILRQAELAIKCADDMTCFTDVNFLKTIPSFYKVMAQGIIANHKLKKLFRDQFWLRSRDLDIS